MKDVVTWSHGGVNMHWCHDSAAFWSIFMPRVYSLIRVTQTVKICAGRSEKNKKSKHKRNVSGVQLILFSIPLSASPKGAFNIRTQLTILAFFSLFFRWRTVWDLHTNDLKKKKRMKKEKNSRATLMVADASIHLHPQTHTSPLPVSVCVLPVCPKRFSISTTAKPWTMATRENICPLSGASIHQK